MRNIYRTGRSTNFKLGTQTEDEDCHHRQGSWPPRSKVKVARSRDASDMCWPTRRERNGLETPKLVGRFPTQRVHTSFKVKAQRSRFKVTRQALWPWKLKVKVAMSRGASDRSAHISIMKSLRNTKIGRKVATAQAIMYTAFKVKGQRSISPGRLMLRQKVRHIVSYGYKYCTRVFRILQETQKLSRVFIFSNILTFLYHWYKKTLYSL